MTTKYGVVAAHRRVGVAVVVEDQGSSRAFLAEPPEPRSVEYMCDGGAKVFLERTNNVVTGQTTKFPSLTSGEGERVDNGSVVTRGIAWQLAPGYCLVLLSARNPRDGQSLHPKNW